MILVTGATGNVGREIVKDLAGRGILTRALVHRPDRIRNLRSPFVEPFVGDLSDLAGLGKAMRRTDGLFLITPASNREARQQHEAIDLARESGIQHVVRLSTIGANVASQVRFAAMHAGIDQHLMDSGLSYTILRPGFFMQNVNVWIDSIRHEGAIYAPPMEGRLSLVDTRDVAKVAVATLLEDWHANRIYDLKGPEALSLGELADELAEATGSGIRYAAIPHDAARLMMLNSGCSEVYADRMLELVEACSSEDASKSNSSIRRVTGRAARGFDAFAKEFAGRLTREEASALM